MKFIFPQVIFKRIRDILLIDKLCIFFHRKRHEGEKGTANTLQNPWCWNKLNSNYHFGKLKVCGLSLSGN